MYIRYFDEITFAAERESGRELNKVMDAKEDTNVTSIEEKNYIEEANNGKEVHVVPGSIINICITLTK